MFLDRDGVLNEPVVVDGAPASPRRIEEFQISQEVPLACARLREAGFALLVVTNQPDVARGDLPMSTLQTMHAKVMSELPIDAVYFCPHDNSDECTCRKPKPGLVLRGASEWNVDLRRSWLIGDRWVDVVAGLAAGVNVVLLTRPWTWDETSAGTPPKSARGVLRRPSLTACVDLVLGKAADRCIDSL